MPISANQNKTFLQVLIEEFQFFHYKDFGHPPHFKHKYIKILEYECDLKQRAKKQRLIWVDFPDNYILAIPLYPIPTNITPVF
jgi:hypothetical protein